MIAKHQVLNIFKGGDLRKYKIAVFDCETDALLEDATKLHIFGYKWRHEGVVRTTTDPAEILAVFKEADMCICHNAILFDDPIIQKLLGFTPSDHCAIFDTLIVAQYIYPEFKKHGLEALGATVGISKVKVGKDEWIAGDAALMESRVSEDVRINDAIFDKIMERLYKLYEGDMAAIGAILENLLFKLWTFRTQHNNPLPFDKGLCITNLIELSSLKEEKVSILKYIMPKVPIYRTKKKPSIMLKKDGSPSANSIKWFIFLKEQGLSENTEGEVKYIHSYAEPNPTSPTQVKAWLFSLGWKPDVFKYNRNKETNEVKKVEQITKIGVPELSDSVLELVNKHPDIIEYESLSTLSHRIGILEGFLNNCNKDGKSIVADMAGITSTLRIRHRKIINLPGVYKPYGDKIRSCLSASVLGDDYVFIGSDISSLENMALFNSIFHIDKKGVEERLTVDYDAHCTLALTAGMMTKEEVAMYKKLDADLEDEVRKLTVSKEEHTTYKKLHKIRHKAKTALYSLQYKIGIESLARALKSSKREAKLLSVAYKKQNWASSVFEGEAQVKTELGTMWVKNKYNGFWYSLRTRKDILSASIQGLGAYIFDMWVYYMTKMGVTISLNYHDEVGIICKKSEVHKHKRILDDAMKYVNRTLQLPVPIKVSTKVGISYADVH